ncbi:MAG: 1-acyl-sn-glycerol-3-phosphate acyltransferase [Bacteroidales bacterium]
MQRILIIGIYFIVFWIALPVAMFLLAKVLDRNYFSEINIPAFIVITGWVVLAIGVTFMCVAVYQFRKFSGEYPVSALPVNRLIEKGMYAVWRHPIYLFAFIALLGLSMASGSFGFISIVMPVFIIALTIYIYVEETYLVRKFGNKYIAYRKRVPIVVPRFWFVLRIPVVLLFRHLFHFEIRGREYIPLETPYFVVAAHRNYLDPFFIGCAFPHQIKFICTYDMFRKKLIRYIVTKLGAIPKKRYKTDLYSNKMLTKALTDGYPVGIFPEGGRSWTGNLRTLKTECIRLFLHFSHFPVVPVKITGNYHAWPRWSNSIFRADIRIEIKPAIRFEPDTPMNITEQTLVDSIHVRPETEDRIIRRKKERTGKLSVVLYRCPSCRRFETLKEVSPSFMKCVVCQYTLKITADLRLQTGNGSPAETYLIRDVYSDIQITLSDLELLKKEYTGISRPATMMDSEIVYYRSYGKFYEEQGVQFILRSVDEVFLTQKRVLLHNREGDTSIPLEEIDGATIEGNDKFQIYQRRLNCVNQIIFDTNCALLWQDLLVLLLQERYNKEIITR